MLAFLTLVATFAASASAQATSFEPGTGVRSLWIPYQTISGTPLASIAGRDEQADVTVYVLNCPTAQPSCAIAPNLTLTEGISMARYVNSYTSGGAATLSCDLTGTTSALCHAAQNQGGQLLRTSSTVAASDINYQAVSVTQTINNTSTLPVTVTVAPSSTTSSTSSSTAGVHTQGGPWAMGGAIGAGLVALAAL